MCVYVCECVCVCLFLSVCVCVEGGWQELSRRVCKGKVSGGGVRGRWRGCKGGKVEGVHARTKNPAGKQEAEKKGSAVDPQNDVCLPAANIRSATGHRPAARGSVVRSLRPVLLFYTSPDDHLAQNKNHNRY